MSYIHYHEVEKLFTAWPTLDGILESLLIDLMATRAKNGLGSDEDYIYTMSIGNKALDNMPPSGKISDSTGNIVANYLKVMRMDKRELKGELNEEVFEVSIVIEKLNIAFRRLSPIRQKVLKLFYWEKLKWKEVSVSLNESGGFMSESSAKIERRRGIEKMASILKVTQEDYESVMKLVDERGLN